MQIHQVKIGLGVVFKRPPSQRKNNGVVTAIKTDADGRNHRLQIDGKFWIYSRNAPASPVEKCEELYLE